MSLSSWNTSSRKCVEQWSALRYFILTFFRSTGTEICVIGDKETLWCCCREADLILSQQQDKLAPSTIELFVTHLSQQQQSSHSTSQANLSAQWHYCHVKHQAVDFDTPRPKLLYRRIKMSSSGNSVPAICISRVSKAYLNACVWPPTFYLILPMPECTKHYLQLPSLGYSGHMSSQDLN